MVLGTHSPFWALENVLIFFNQKKKNEILGKRNVLIYNINLFIFISTKL